MSSHKLPQIVEVEWLDTVSTGGWRQLEERLAATLPKDMEHRSAGYLLKTDRAFIVLAMSFSDNIGTVAETVQIPRRAVKRITKLSRP